jgi:succinoglycan biosynthesis protein ExoM
MVPALKTVDICIATYRRPALLAALLTALAQQDRRGMAVRLIVIDNDRHGTAAEAARAGAASAGLPLLYQIEPQQNIALARNRALRLSQAEYIIFIDDDETPAPGWLAALLTCCAQSDADLVFGPVDSVLPADAPAWAHACFYKPPVATGAALRYGGAGNVLIRRSVLDQPAPWFDPGYGLTGGEDLDWFYRLHLAGKRLVWCAEASASEPVPPARLQLRWVRRRAFRGGQTYYRVVVRRRPWRSRWLWFGGKALQLLAGLALAPLLRYANYPAFVQLTLRLAGSAGQLSRSLLPYDYEEYHARHQP